ncbi:DMT family transporter [Microvirga antarctica]|uniref:DMT family transporter n=1 Tax=Microvirga antarctica TaxID=2819233 RepID=UPI001B3180C5
MPASNVLRVIVWMTGALLAFSATAVGVRGLSRAFSVFEILAMRNALGVAILLALVLVKPRLRHELKPRRIKTHLVRNVLHFLGTDGWAYCIAVLPLATAFALEFTAPAWVALLAIPLLKERLTRPRLVAIVAGFTGVLIILRPGVETFQPASALMLVVAFVFALVAIVTKRLTLTESTFSIVFMMNVIQLPLNLIWVDGAFWQKIELVHAWPIAGVSLGGLLSHYCLTNAYRYGDASMVMPLDFLRIPLIAIVGWRLYGEALDPYVFVGSACIIAGLFYSLRREARTT